MSNGMYCKSAPRQNGGYYLDSKSGQPKKHRPKAPRKKPRFRHPNSKARVLCKHGGMTFYDDHTLRPSSNDFHEGDYGMNRWEIVPFPKTGQNMLFFKYGVDDENPWMTEWASDNPDEVKLGEAVARALVNHETKKFLLGQYDEETSDEPRQETQG